MKHILTTTISATALAITQSFSASAAQESKVTEVTDNIEVLVVTASKINDTLNPSTQSLSGIFGEGISIADTPRSVTSISAAAIEQYNIVTLEDIVKVAPNTFASSGFGTGSLPSIRGQLGELFQDGVRRQAGNNGFGIPLSFNSIDQIDVVKGPSPVLLGSTQRNGGFVNLQTKKASVKQNAGNVTLRAGRWDQYSAEVDYNAVIKEGESAIRVSAEILDHGSFYDFSEQKSENLFVAFAWQPNERTSWDLSLEYYDVDFTDSAGFNRPTQQLIDDGLYITGQGVQANGSTVAGDGAVVSPTGVVEISRSRVFTNPDDINNAQTTIARSNFSYLINDSLTLRNITYYQYLDREEIAQNSFVEIIDGADTFENRIELDVNWNADQITTVALDVRYNNVLGFSQFTTEADSPVDLTGPLSNRVITLTDEQQARLVEIREGVFVSPGAQTDIDNDGIGDFNLSDTTDSISVQTGLALQQRSQWTPKFSTIAGYRLDYYDVNARDPLAPEGFEAAEDNFYDTLQSFQLSATYAINDSLNIYAAYADNEATSNSLGGGTALGSDNQINELNFATENDLYELGVKYAPSESNWYAEGSVFKQRRSLRNRDGSNTGVITKGLELQAFYENDNYWVNAGYSYLDPEFDNSAAFQANRVVTDAFDNSRPDIIEGTGVVGEGFFTAFDPSDSQVQGIPEQIVSVNTGLNITEAFQIGASALYTKSYPLDFLQTVFIRDQINVDLNANYQINENLKVRVDITNVTDEENFQPIFEGGFFGATLVLPNLPRHTRFTVEYSF